MLCDNCLHKNVCKHVEKFKLYEKQYEEIKKESALFDKPIECPCFITISNIYKDFKGFENSLNKIKDSAKESNEELKNTIIKAELKRLQIGVSNTLKHYEKLFKLQSIIILGERELKDSINQKFEKILKDLDELKIN